MSDMLSKGRLEVWEFGLQPSMASFLWVTFVPTIDLFASQRFHLLPRYCSWYLNPVAVTRDAFSITWPEKAFAFHPVPLLDMVLQKIRRDKVTVLLVVPNFTGALWWQQMEPMLLRPPVSLGFHRTKLVMGPRGRLPYLGSLMACLVRG